MARTIVNGRAADQWTIGDLAEAMRRAEARHPWLSDPVARPVQSLPTPEEMHTLRVQVRMTKERMWAHQEVVRDIALTLERRDVSDREKLTLIGQAVQRV